MGGVATLVDDADSKFALKTSAGTGDNEYIVTRHSQFLNPVNIITLYGQQESQSNTDDIERRWNELMEEVSKIEERSEQLVIAGDFNAHLGDIVVNNHEKISYGGQLVRDFVLAGNYVLVNQSEKTEGGPFTRYDPSDPKADEKKSLLDLVIISKSLEKYLDKMVVDKDLLFTPFHSNSKAKLTYPDHYSLLTVFKNIPMKVNRIKNGIRETFWNLNKKGGWKRYFEETDKNKVLDSIENDVLKNVDPTRM